MIALAAALPWLVKARRLARAVPAKAWLVAGGLALAGLYHWHAVSASYQSGHAAASAGCRAAALQAEIDGARMDLDAARAAAARAEEAEKGRADYEAELAKRPDGRCRATRDDVRRMQPYPAGGAAAVPLPPRRRDRRP